MKLRNVIFALNCAWLICAMAPAAEPAVGGVSLHTANGYIIVPFYIFDHWRWFALDTTGEVTTLHTNFLIHFRPVPSATADALRERMPFTDFYIGQKFFLGQLYPSPKYFLASDLNPIEHLSATTVDGLLALDVLTNYQVTLDFAATNATFRTNATQSAAGALPFGFEGNSFAFTASLATGKHVLLGVDTLDRGEVSLNSEDWLKAFPEGTEKRARVMVADRRGKFAEQMEARLPIVKIGNESYTNLICQRLPDKISPSIMGSAFLRRHRVTLDYPNRQIRFERKKNDGPTEEDMTGLHLKWVRYSAVVASIDPESPAEESGLAAGDEILWIGEKRISRMDQSEIEAAFRAGDGMKLDIVALHGATEVTNKLVLKRRL